LIAKGCSLRQTYSKTLIDIYPNYCMQRSKSTGKEKSGYSYQARAAILARESPIYNIPEHHFIDSSQGDIV